jgi:uncharacterized Tic20 family protein
VNSSDSSPGGAAAQKINHQTNMSQPHPDNPQVPPVRTTPPEGKEPLMPTSDERLWATLAHLSILVISIVGPLIIWLIKKEESRFVEDQAKEALNFQISFVIVFLISSVTCLGPLVVLVGGIIFGILAAMESNRGVYYRYQFTFRLIQ